MKLKKRNYYGFDHAKIDKKFKGDLTYVNDFCIAAQHGGYVTAAVYHAANPDTKLGHKEFMLLFSVYNVISDESQYYVTGRTAEQMKKEAKVSAVWCKECDSVLYSLHRHDFHSCGCPNGAFVDGGRDYIRSGAKDLNKTEIVTVNLLTDRISKPKRSRKRA